MRSISWFELFFLGSGPFGGGALSLRRNPSVNHWAKWEKSTVDFGHGVDLSSGRTNRSATASTLGRPGAAATAGRCRLQKVLSVSDAHDVCGDMVLNGFGR